MEPDGLLRAARGGGGGSQQRIWYAARRRGPRQCLSGADACEEGERCIVQRNEGTIVYEALLTQSDSLAQVQAMRRQIEQVGGALRVEQAGRALLVTLTLPAQYSPDRFFPGMPFFPV